jgi:pseudouridine kinase
MGRKKRPSAGERLVIVVGGINMDIQGRSYATFRPGDSNPGDASCVPGGVGRNIAENLVRLGEKVELIGVLGNDALSGELEASCATLEIGLSRTLRLPQSSASQYICLLDPEGKLVGAVASMQDYTHLQPEYLSNCIDLLDAADCIVVDSNIPQSSIEWLAGRYGRLREASGMTTGHVPWLVLDPVSAAKAKRACRSIGLFSMAKPNIGEARILSGGGFAGTIQPRDVRWSEEEVREADSSVARSLTAEAKKLGAALRARGLGEVFISLGPEGLYFEGPGTADTPIAGIVRPPFPLPEELAIRNVSGAGDSACAALVWSRLEGCSIADRAALGLAAALLTAASTSTVNPAMNPEILLRIAKGAVYESFS